MNKYGPISGSPRGWAVSLAFDLNADVVRDGEAGEGGVPIVYDQWMNIRVEIDLDANIRSTYYNNTLVRTSMWYDEYNSNHAKSIAAVDLWADAGGDPVYYDDLSIPGTPIVRPPRPPISLPQ